MIAYVFANADTVMDGFIRVCTYFGMMYSVAMFVIKPIAKRIRKRYAEQEALDMARLMQFRSRI